MIPPNPALSRTAVATAALSLLMAGCGTVPSISDLSDDGTVTRHGGALRMTVDATFEEVWPEVVDIAEQRGYAEVEREQAEREKTYRIQGEQEDRHRDKLFRETVTERHGHIVADTGEGRAVALELQEQHAWEMSVLDQINAASGGAERYRLAHEGVEITAGDTTGTELDRAELREVFDAIDDRFQDESM